jgi:FAD:protein FMN transferase
MGSPCEIQIDLGASARDGASQRAETLFSLAVAEVERLEARYSRYRAESFLSEINRVAAAGGSIEVDAETAGLLDYAATCHAESGGLFDVTSGILRRAWRFAEGRLPRKEEVASLLEHVGWKRLDWRRPVLSFPTPGLELDFGGIVKEYAADRIAALLRTEGASHAFVNLGGDVRVVGPRADERPWQIGIRHPRRPGELLARIAVGEGAVATSGDYERCIEIDGVRYGHLLDPRTGWPVRSLAQVSVLAPLCVVAGSASTIAMLRGAGGADWLGRLGLPSLWVDMEGRTGGSLARSGVLVD